MNSPLPVHGSSTGDEAPQLLRAMEWDPTGQLCKRLLIGTLIHVALMAPWLLSLPPNAAEDSRPARYDTAVPIFAPPASALIPRTLTLAPPGLPMRVEHDLIGAAEEGEVAQPARLPMRVEHDLIGAAVQELAMDLTAMKLSFADDVGAQLPEVVRKNGGALALLDKNDPTIARYTLQPPFWEVQEGIRDVSRKFRLTMDPPQKWAVFRNVAERYGIDLDHYQACAMFDAAYSRCLQDAIRTRALSAAPHSAGRVSSALLAFARDRPCGIEVLEVTVATKVDQ